MEHPTFTEREPFSPITYTYKAKRLASVRSNLQLIEVYSSPDFGRILVIDGVVQLTERDEYIYHEMLAHVPLHIHARPERVLIIGGGDGGTLREVTRHQEVRDITLVEIDPEVVNVSKKWLPSLSVGFGDPRVKLIIEDGLQFLKRDDSKYDIILVDSTDPVGAAAKLFELPFYKDAAGHLYDHGIFTCQSESLHFHLETVKRVQKSLRSCFQSVDLYTVCIPTYPGNLWTFSIASRSLGSRSRLERAKVKGQYYDTDVHNAAFIPKSLLKKLDVAD